VSITWRTCDPKPDAAEERNEAEASVPVNPAERRRKRLRRHSPSPTEIAVEERAMLQAVADFHRLSLEFFPDDVA
jgi:hypothetical protein